MDEVDLTLVKILLANSRSPYRVLADQLGLSVNAVHKRVQSMLQSGEIAAFTAKASLSALRGNSIHMFGISDSESLYGVMDQLGSHESTYWVSLAGGNSLYVGAYFRSISELQSYVDFVTEVGRMLDPTVGIIYMEEIPGNIPSQTPARDKVLQPLDYEIIYALRNDSRRAISDVAEEIGVSAKTVRRRLSRMIENGLIELSLEWYPDKSNDIITFVDLSLGSSSDKNEVSRVIQKDYSPNIVYIMSYSNLPNHMLGVLWTRTMKEMRDISERLGREKAFSCSTPNVVYAGKIYDTWRDELVIREGAPARRDDP